MLYSIKRWVVALFRHHQKGCSHFRWALPAFLKGIVGLVCFFSLALADETKDYLLDSKAQVVENFGSGSTFMHYVYFAEVIIALVSFVKVKNPLLLTGVLVLLIVAPILMNAALGS